MGHLEPCMVVLVVLAMPFGSNGRGRGEKSPCTRTEEDDFMNVENTKEDMKPANRRF